jgi:uroporphyrin-III C-methyltransferase / precorrin-2 dehydrogenase / sirohydrochlorin ferrochelatase
MNPLPIFLKLEARNALLIGAGNVAMEKIGTLLPTGLNLRVIAPQALPKIHQLARENNLELVLRPFQPSDLDGQFIAIAATNDPAVNQLVHQLCVERNIPCNSVDDIPNCDFFFGSIVTRGALQIAISTSGESPAVAQHLRREIDAQLPANIGPWLENLGEFRRQILATHPRTEERKLLLHQLAQLPLCESESCPSRQLANPIDLGAPGPSHLGTGETTKVALVGAGPGDPDLLTLKALRLIQSAEVILHDDLVPDAILALASPAAEKQNVGKRCGAKAITQDEINALMVAHARAHRSVVRLKSGDPLIFGRAAEEIAALAAAGVPFEIVPGITAASAAAAALGCSLTDRDAASNVTFSTGHHAQSHNHAPLPEIEDTTRVVYMPGRDLTLLAAEWLSQGLPPDFPCAVISHAAQPTQQVRCTTLAALGDLAHLPAPSLLIAGWTVRNIAAALQPEAAGAKITA